MIRAAQATSRPRRWRRILLATIVSLVASAVAVILLSGGRHAETPIRVTSAVADHSPTEPSRSLTTARRHRQIVADSGCGGPMRERGASGPSRIGSLSNPPVHAAR